MKARKYQVGDKCNGGVIVGYTDESARFMIECDKCGNVSKRQASINQCAYCYKERRVKYSPGTVLPSGNIIVSTDYTQTPPIEVVCGSCGVTCRKFIGSVDAVCSECRYTRNRRGFPKGTLKKIRSYRGSAKKRNYSWELTDEEAAVLFSLPCEYCGGSDKDSGIDRKDNSLGYTTDNVVACCSICNFAKRDKTMEEWIGWMKRVAARYG